MMHTSVRLTSQTCLSNSTTSIPPSQVSLSTTTNSKTSYSTNSFTQNKTGINAFTIRPSARTSFTRYNKKLYPKDKPYNEILKDVVFVLSGFANPERRKIKDLAIRMGATYQIYWTAKCTHLICSFKFTHKYNLALKLKGRIVKDKWLQDCHTFRKLLDWRPYKLGRYNYPDSEEEVDIYEFEYALQTGYGIPSVFSQHPLHQHN